MEVPPITHSILDTILLFIYLLHLLLCSQTLANLPLYQKSSFVASVFAFTLTGVLLGFTWAGKDEKGLSDLTNTLRNKLTVTIKQSKVFWLIHSAYFHLCLRYVVFESSGQYGCVTGQYLNSVFDLAKHWICPSLRPAFFASPWRRSLAQANCWLIFWVCIFVHFCDSALWLYLCLITSASP